MKQLTIKKVTFGLVGITLWVSACVAIGLFQSDRSLNTAEGNNNSYMITFN